MQDYIVAKNEQKPAASRIEYKSNIFKTIDSISEEAHKIRNDCEVLNSVPVGDLESLAKFRKYDESAYDIYLGTDEVFAKIVSERKKEAERFNQLLDKRIEEARKFIIDANEENYKQEKLSLLEEIGKRDSKLCESESRLNELGLYLRAEQQQNSILEYQLNAERESRSRLEKHLDNLAELKKVCSALADDTCNIKNTATSIYKNVIDGLNALAEKLDCLANAESKNFEHSGVTESCIYEGQKEKSALLNGQKTSFRPSFTKSVSEMTELPVSYELLRLKKAALGEYGDNSLQERLERIYGIINCLSITDSEADISFLKAFESAMRLSFEKGDIRDAMKGLLCKNTAKDSLNAVQDYLLKCIQKRNAPYEKGMMIDAA